MVVGLRCANPTYSRLGQSATTLSGGEMQRVKLALELSKRDTGRTLYILDVIKTADWVIDLGQRDNFTGFLHPQGVRRIRTR